MFLGNYRKTGSGGAKEHLRDHSNYVETLEHLASSLNSRQAVHKRYRAASHCMVECTRLAKKVKPPSRVAIYYGLISDAWQLTALLRCGFTSALTLMSLTLLFIHSLLPLAT